MVQLIWLYSFMNYAKPEFDRPLRMQLMVNYVKNKSSEDLEKIIDFVNSF